MFNELPAIRRLREKVQTPRRGVDTFYGRHVMRRLSVYITALLVPFPVHPTMVNLASALAGLAGAWLLASQHWVAGILLVNAWYLLDHVDGEVARYRGISYATGLYADTITNTIVIPASLFGLGVGLNRGDASNIWLFAGAAAAYGSLMLFVGPYCENTVVLQRWKQGRMLITPAPGRGPSPGIAVSAGTPKRIFMFMHQCVTFPVFLPVATVLILALCGREREWLEPALKGWLLVGAVFANIVWVALVFHNVWTQKIDKEYAETRP